MGCSDELRLMTKVARLYYERSMKQSEIAKVLDISQPTCSRLLKRALADRIVRIIVTPPSGTCLELEEALEAEYRLKEAIVVDIEENEEQTVRGLGTAAVYYLETTLKPEEGVGISSWSATLLAMVDAMKPPSARPPPGRGRVVQILGGIGSPSAPTHEPPAMAARAIEPSVRNLRRARRHLSLSEGIRRLILSSSSLRIPG